MARRTVAQGLVLGGTAAALAVLVVSSADGWADWVVFAAVLLTAYGAAVAVAPRRYTTRRRAISRSSDDAGTLVERRHP